MMDGTFYELRLYQVERGRMQDMITRRRGALQALFQKHGIAPLGNWYSMAGPNSPLFVYLMRWPDWTARQKAWAGFYGDPDWWDARESTNAGSELVERYELNLLKEIKSWTPGPDDALQTLELHLPAIDIGQSVKAAALVREETCARLAASGGHLLGAFEFLTGNDLPRAALFIGWKNDAAADDACQVLERAPFNRSDRYRLKPISLAVG